MRVHLSLDGLLEGKKFVNVPVVLKAPARQLYNKLLRFQFIHKNETQDTSELSPSTQFHRLVKPPFAHGLLHQLCLQQMTQSKTTTISEYKRKA